MKYHYLMLLIADSGSTKTDWRLIDGLKISQFQTEGLNPHFLHANKLAEVLQGLPIDNHLEVKKVCFYGSGCNSIKSDWMKGEISLIFSNANVFVYSDLLAVAHATLGSKKGLVGILGTGSNIAYYNGSSLVQKTPSLGFLLGDEGGGSYLGKKFISHFLKDEVPIGLLKKFKYSKDEVLQKVYQSETPNRYLASFVPFLFRNRMDPFISSLIQHCFHDWMKQYVSKYNKCDTLNLVGSIAFYFHNEIREVAKSYGYKVEQILETPIAALTHYYLPSE